MEAGNYVFVKAGTNHPEEYRETVWRVVSMTNDTVLCTNKDHTVRFDKSDVYATSFQIGNYAEVVHGAYKGTIGRISKVEKSKYGITYCLSGIDNRFHCNMLELRDGPGIEIGDVVYINPKTVENKQHCYKLFTAVEKEGSIITCEVAQNVQVGFEEKYLAKPFFKVGQHIYYSGEEWVIAHIYFSAAGELCYKLTFMNKIRGVAESLLLRENPEIVDYKISNQNENQLQRETTPERGEDVPRKGGLHGRRTKASICIGCLSNQARAGCS